MCCQKWKHLSSEQANDLKKLLVEFVDVFSDTPPQTNVMQHDVDEGDAKPIKQHPYRLGPIKEELIDKEV